MLAAWVMWAEQPYLIDQRRFRRKYFQILNQVVTPLALRRLIYVYLRDFGRDPPHRYRVADLIRNHLSRLTRKSLDRWRDAQEKYALFDPKDGPIRLAKAAYDDGRSMQELELDVGLIGDLSGPVSICATAFSALLVLIEKGLSEGRLSGERIRTLLSSAVENGELRFPGQRVEIVHAVLRPWLHGFNPGGDAQSATLDFLIEYYKDPRIQPARHWQGVEKPVIDLVRRWLAHETLDQFFEIVSKSALDRHWAYRRAFWSAYYRHEALDDAWLVLGPQAYSDAVESLGSDVACGRLRGGEVQANHSVLLMRVSGLVISEWSHNGKCRAWEVGDNDAPALGRISQYSRRELVTGSLKIDPGYRDPGLSHMSSDTYRWQNVMANFIYRYTNIRVEPEEYSVRDQR